MAHRTARLALVTGGAAALVLTLGTPSAYAHVGTSEDEVAAGSTTAMGLTIGHGCEDSPTNKVAFQIPDGVNNATPFAKAGWTIVSEDQTLTTPLTSSHGEEVTERVATITFTADPGNALPSDVRDTFTINFTAPETPGETLFFKTVQTCEVGENAWIDEWDGTGTEPDSPAPSVLVVDATGDDGHHAEDSAAAPDEAATDQDVSASTAASGDDAGDDADAAGEAGVTEMAATSASDDGGSATGIAVAGLVVGALGLAAGGTALVKTRKTS